MLHKRTQVGEQAQSADVKKCTREQVDVDCHCKTNEQKFLGSEQRSENKYSSGQEFMSLDIVWSTIYIGQNVCISCAQSVMDQIMSFCQRLPVSFQT